MKTILITGSDGQLGQELQGLSFTHTYRDYKFFHTDIDTLDITDRDQVRKFIAKNRVSYIINCASYTNVDKAESEQETAVLVNGKAPGVLKEACADNNAHLLHISTDFVFDGRRSVPYREDHSPNPLSFYGKTKLEGEKAVLKYEYGAVIRTSWLYSSYGNNFFRTILRHGADKDELNIVYDQVGTPTYARDLARVLLTLAVNTLSGEKNCGGQIFHYSNEGVCSWYDFAFEIVRLAGLQCRINPIESSQYPLPAKRPHFSVLNKTKIKSYLSIDIPHWRDSLKSCMDQLD